MTHLIIFFFILYCYVYIFKYIVSVNIYDKNKYIVKQYFGFYWIILLCTNNLNPETFCTNNYYTFILTSIILRIMNIVSHFIKAFCGFFFLF